MIERRGGKRAGAGRKKTGAARVTYSVDITPHQAELLKIWGAGDVSCGLRWLIDNAEPLVGPWAVFLTHPQQPAHSQVDPPHNSK